MTPSSIELRDPADGRCDDGPTHRERLQDRERQTLGKRRQDHDVGRLHQGRDVCAVPEEPNTVRDLARGRLVDEVVAFRAVTSEDRDEIRHVLHGRDERRVALLDLELGRHKSDLPHATREQRAAQGPHGRRAGYRRLRDAVPDDREPARRRVESNRQYLADGRGDGDGAIHEPVEEPSHQDRSSRRGRQVQVFGGDPDG